MSSSWPAASRILIWMDWRLFLAGMAPLPLAVWALVAYRRRIEGATAELRQRSADLGSFLIETLSGMRTVVTAGAGPREVARFGRLNDAFIHTLMGVQRIHYLSGGVPSLLMRRRRARCFSTAAGAWCRAR